MAEPTKGVALVLGPGFIGNLFQNILRIFIIQILPKHLAKQESFLVYQILKSKKKKNLIFLGRRSARHKLLRHAPASTVGQCRLWFLPDHVS
jgi:hypothetical protein